MEDDRTSIRTVQAHIVIENMVAPESFTKSWHTRIDEILLPIKPPEVYPLRFTTAKNVTKHHLIERTVLQLPRYITRGIGQTKVANHITKKLLIVVHAISRVQIQTHLQVALMHKTDELFGFRNNRLIPSPACPALGMPVHVEYHHVNRNIILLNFGSNIHKILLCIALILAIPVA